MNNPAFHKEDDIGSGIADSEAQNQLTELRNLLLEPEQTELENLRERLDDPGIHARDVSRILSQAVVLSTEQDTKLASALTPTVTEIIRISIKKDIRVFADVLFPVIGPAIRKSIAETFKQMIQSLNYALERRFSWQGIKWRMEAFRSGKQFAEIVLLHSLVYRVEQVFLIHRETGILLQHVTAGDQTHQDADLVSSMLAAIQDFVRDSFNMDKSEGVNNIEMGDLILWVEQGPGVIIAGAIRGTAPESLRTVFHNALENIHLESNDAIEKFDGDPAPFDPALGHLELCLQSRFREKSRKISPVLLVVFATLIVILGLWAFWSYREHRSWEEYLNRLDAEPGIVITNVSQHDGNYYVTGLRDPLARNPDSISGGTGIDPEKIIFRWEPYQALYPGFVVNRAKKILDPPETVVLKINNGILEARGTASTKWLIDARRLVKAIPGVIRFDETQFKDSTLEELRALKTAVENKIVFFSSGESVRSVHQGEELELVHKDIKRLIDLSLVLDLAVNIEIRGHTDSSGTNRNNLQLSRERAEYVRNFMITRGMENSILKTQGMGADRPLTDEQTEQEKELNRSVTFRVNLAGRDGKEFDSP